MERELKMEMALILTLTIDEADWLNARMQNPLPDGESAFDTKMRQSFFRATAVPKPLKPLAGEAA